MVSSTTQLICTLVLSLPLIYVLTGYLRPASHRPVAPDTATPEPEPEKEKPKTIMQPANADLAPPKDDPFTQEELKEFDGSDSSKPIYVAIKGTVFDVTNKREMYGPGKSYNIFAGKDGSKGLGKSSLKEEDAVSDYTDLPPDEIKVLDDWHDFFSKRYNIVGRVSDLQPYSANL